MTDEVARIASGLSEAQRELLPCLSSFPRGASELPEGVRQYPRYRDPRLITQVKAGHNRFYALTRLGTAVRAYLLEQSA